MQKMRVVINGEPIVCHEVEFVDMDHTLEWLLETVENYRCAEALTHLKAAKKLLEKKRKSIFGYH